MSQLSDPDKKLLDELRKELDDIKFHEERLKELFIKASRQENHVNEDTRNIIKKEYISLACRGPNLDAFLLESDSKSTNISKQVVNSYNKQIDYLYEFTVNVLNTHNIQENQVTDEAAAKRKVENYYKFRSDYQLTNDEKAAWSRFVNSKSRNRNFKNLDVYAYYSSIQVKKSGRKKTKDTVLDHLMKCMRKKLEEHIDANNNN